MNKLLLNHISQYINVGTDDLKLFRDVLELRKLSKREYLLTEGNICNHEYFVIRGGLRQYETDLKGKELIIHFGFENWWITDKHSLLTQTPSAYNIEALEDTEVLQISRERLEELFVKSPLLERYFHKVLQDTFVMWQHKILFLQKPAEERYRLFRDMYGDVEQRISQQHVASYLGITRETLSRLKTQILKKVR